MPKKATTIVITEIENRGGANFGYFYFSDGVRVGYHGSKGDWTTSGGGRNWPDPTPLRHQVVREYLHEHGPVMLERAIDIDNQGSIAQPWGSVRISDGTEAEFFVSHPGASDGVMLTLAAQEDNEPSYVEGMVAELIEVLAGVDWSALPAAGKVHPAHQDASV